MSRNAVFERALALLAHPFSLGALGLLLLNDHLLRRFWPSWLTGKLGDLAWLFFAPLALGTVLSWLVPPVYSRRGKSPDPLKRERRVFTLAFALTGAVFVLVKTLPSAHFLAVQALTALLHDRPALVRDPSDLLALPALALSFWLWRATITLPYPNPAQPLRAARGLVALPLAALLTLANAGIPDPGIQCFMLAEEAVFADAGYSSFRSDDGGLTWTYVPNLPSSCTTEAAASEDWQEVEGAPDGARFRYRPNQAIQVSTDGGQTWQTAYNLEPASEAEQIYYTRRMPGNTVFQPGPLDAAVDPRTGSVLFAMGHQGVLVRQPSGEWTWSMGGQYQRVQRFPTPDAFYLLLGSMSLLALGTLLLIFSSLALRWTRHPMRITTLVLAWIAWFLITLLFPPATSNGYTQVASSLGMLAGAVLIVPLVIEQIIRLTTRAPHALPRLVLFAVIGGLLFFLPYVLWLFNALPSLFIATIFAVVLALAVLAAGAVQLGRKPQMDTDRNF